VLNDPTIVRPLLETTKRGIYDYACERGLEWVEDSTNHGEAYLRNRMRRRLRAILPETKQTLLELWRLQRELASQIDHETMWLPSTSRYFMTMIDESSGLELLRRILADHGLTLPRPQRRRLLYAVKTARPGTTYEAGGGVKVGFTKREFIVKHPL
jgi:tRNA(Ile)-lysidine synthase TilS/MesJ